MNYHNTHSTFIITYLGATIDCAGVAFGTRVTLVCGCDDATSCLDCAGVPRGDATVDRCGVCRGIDDAEPNSCVDCAGVPHGRSMYDDCGVCRGNVSNRRCTIYAVITNMAQSRCHND